MNKDWHERISQPQHGIKAERDIYVPMRDGVRLAINVFRPDTEGKFPALLALGPHGKDNQDCYWLPPQPLDKSPLWDGCIEAGDTEYIVSRGYAHIVADSRNCGKSEGEGAGPKGEGGDGYDLVEWVAQQPWCDGNVGMTGYSAYAMASFATAAEQPPHLKAIYFEGTPSDFYRGMTYSGGVLCLFLYGIEKTVGTSGPTRKNVVSAMMKTLPEEEFERRRQEALNNPDIRYFPNLYQLLHYPHKDPAFFDIVLNPYDGPFYWRMSATAKADKVKTPVYMGAQWAHFYMPVGIWNVYHGLNAPKKIIFRSVGHASRPWRDDLDVQIRWYDHWLKGIDTGMMAEPPIKLYIVGINQWRYEEEWPLPHTEWTKFYLHGWEELSLEPEIFNNEPDGFFQQPLHVSTKRDSVIYLTPPLAEDLEVIGPAALYFYASIDQDDTNWIVKLLDVDERGSETRLGTSYLKASHRAVDAGKSKPYTPWHPHTSSEPVTPGEIYEYAIELSPVGNMFKAGHRVKLAIGSMESARDPDMYLHYHPHLCSSKATLHKIYRDKEHQSHLLLPVIPKK